MEIGDKNLIKVLSSDTRVEILKELSEKQLTPTDLSKRLGKNKSTIVEHLQVLQDSGLVERNERPGRKFIFYSLTESGRGVASPVPEKRVAVVARILSVIFAIFAFIFVAAGGVILTEYVFHFPMLLFPMVSDFAYFTFVGFSMLGIIALFLKKVPNSGIYVGIIFGLLVLPYGQFAFGHMDFFVKDDNLAKGIRAEEVRFDLTVEMHDVNSGEWVIAIDSALMTLYPGENYVYLDSVNLPAGRYDMSRSTTYAEVDIVVDFNVFKPEILERGIDDDAIHAQISSDLGRIGAELKNYRRDDMMLYYTIALTKIEEQPEVIDYPGIGGPDIYIHVILDELGRPTTIEKTMKMPPGFGGIDMDRGPGNGGMGGGRSGTGGMTGPGGCKTPGECTTYCTNPENLDECIQWCDENPSMCPRKPSKPPKGDSTTTTGPGECKTVGECATYCSKPENLEECTKWCDENPHPVLCQITPLGGQRGGPTTVVGPGGCTTAKECAAYCTKSANFNECAQWCRENPELCG